MSVIHLTKLEKGHRFDRAKATTPHVVKLCEQATKLVLLYGTLVRYPNFIFPVLILKSRLSSSMHCADQLVQTSAPGLIMNGVNQIFVVVLFVLHGF